MKVLKRLCVVCMAAILAAGIIPAAARADGISLMSLSKGTSTISVSGKLVSYTSKSTGSGIEDSISVTAYLQEYRNGVWTTIASVSNTATNAVVVSVGSSKTVTGGYYYRTMGYHKVVTNKNTTALFSYTPSVWIP